MRLIDADELLEQCEEMDKIAEGISQVQLSGMAHIEQLIIEAPTVDAVPVVRCKDCIHRYVTGDVTKYYVCDFMDAQYEDNGYCHHGERRKP